MKDYNPPINKGTRGITSNSNLVDQAIKEFDLRNFNTSNNLFKRTNPKSNSIYWYMGHISLINGSVMKQNINWKNNFKDFTRWLVKICWKDYIEVPNILLFVGALVTVANALPQDFELWCHQVYFTFPVMLSLNHSNDNKWKEGLSSGDAPIKTK